MSRIRILVCRVDGACPDSMTELAAIDLPQFGLICLSAETALDTLETCTLEAGHSVLRAAFESQWMAVDAQLVEAYRQGFSPGLVHCDGHKPITLASRLGTLRLPR